MCVPRIRAFLEDLLTSWDLDHLQQHISRAYEFDNVDNAYYITNSAQTGLLMEDQTFFILSD